MTTLTHPAPTKQLNDAQRLAESIRANGWPCIGAVGRSCISGTDYFVGIQEDGSLLAWLKDGTIVACEDCATHRRMDRYADVCRRLTQLTKETRARQIRQMIDAGTIIDYGGHTWIADTAWTTDGDFVELR